MTDSSPNDPQVAELAARLDSDAASDLLAQLRAARGAELVLDGAGVTFLGGKCLLALLSARSAWAADGLKLQLRAPSEALTKGARDMGADLTDMCLEDA